MAYECDCEALCERFYDAAVDPDEWGPALDEIARFAGCAWAALLTRRSDAWIGWRLSSADAPLLEAYLRSDAPKRSITTARLFSINHPGFLSDQEHFSEEERRTDGFFEWANSHGFRYGAATGFQLNTGDLAVVQLMRRAGDTPFNSSELHSLDQLRPHLARAAMLAARWRMERLRAATEALALIGLPAVVLTADCRILSGNDLADHLTNHLLWFANGRLGLADTAASIKLQQQVSRCARAGSLYSASSFPTWDGERTAAMVVHVIPLQGDRRELFDGGMALVLFTPAGSPGLPDCDLIRELFDLTAAEARVAGQLASGRTVEEIADAHQVSISTVRSQAKTILHKVGAHRQAELVVRLGGAGTVRPVLPGARHTSNH